jgi:hypothetical protein
MKSFSSTTHMIVLAGALLLSFGASAQNNTISGTVFEDEDFDGVKAVSEPGRGAIMVFLHRDVNQNGALDGGGVLLDSVLTMPDGTFSFSKAFATNTVTSQVAVSADDAEERISNGVVTLNSTDLELIYDGYNQYVGIRFPNITIPQGTTISSAYIDFVVDEVQTGSTSLTLRGQNADNAAAFATTGYNISGRPLTTASVAWNSVPSWSTIGDTKTSPDIRTIVQEIVNRSGWSSGNALVVRVNGSGRRTAVAQDLNTGAGPILRINYPTGTNDYFIVEFEAASIAPGSPVSTSYTRAITFTDSGQSSTGNDFGYLGLESSCFMSADNGDALHLGNRYTGSNREIGSFGVPDVEAIALNIDRDTLWAADADQLGIVNMMTGAFSALSQPFGTADGAWGPWLLDDVDGLSFDPINGILWGTQREDAAMDLIFQINRNTGAHIPDAFGPGIDYVVLNGTGMLGDLDDIAVNPTTGQLYATNNNSGGLTQLITINSVTGEGTIITSLGINDVEGQGFSNDGNFYAVTGEVAGGSNNNAFWKINISTGALTKLSTMNSDSDFEGCDCLTGTAKNVITGFVFEDVNSDAVYNSGDEPYANGKVYIHEDVNENQQWDAADVLEDSTLTNTVGYYRYIRYVASKYVLTVEYASLPSTSSMTTDSLESAPFTGLGQFDINNNFGFDFAPLPVELVSFTATWNDGVVDLKWTTASEYNNDHFEVERSGDGIHPETIALVPANNSLKRLNDYSAMDEQPLAGTSYYRLKQVDVGGGFTNSTWVKVIAPMSTDITLYPNPVVDGHLVVNTGEDINPESTTLLVMDMQGVVREAAMKIRSTISGTQYDIEVSVFEPGMYFIQGITGSESFSLPFVIPY